MSNTKTFLIKSFDEIIEIPFYPQCKVIGINESHKLVQHVHGERERHLPLINLTFKK